MRRFITVKKAIQDMSFYKILKNYVEEHPKPMEEISNIYRTF